VDIFFVMENLFPLSGIDHPQMLEQVGRLQMAMKFLLHQVRFG
jgi:hypothetical protein